VKSKALAHGESTPHFGRERSSRENAKGQQSTAGPWRRV